MRRLRLFAILACLVPVALILGSAWKAQTPSAQGLPLAPLKRKPDAQGSVRKAHEAPADHPLWIKVSQIVRRKCLACHLGGDLPIDFATYKGMMEFVTSEDQQLIKPGKPDDSALVHYTHWNPVALPDHAESPWGDSPHMPPDEEEWLTYSQMSAISTWIAQGAPRYDYSRPRTLNQLMYPSAHECKSCHPKQFAEWSRSMHAYAQHSPVFEAFSHTMIERTHGTVGTFCSRCHTPIGTALGETGKMSNKDRSDLSMEGISCVVCHRRHQPQGRVNGMLSLEPGTMESACLYGPFTDPDLPLGDRHPAAGSEYIKSATFCGSCHDVTSPAGVRLEEAFTEWRNSPAAKQGITCQQCHMGPTPGVPTADHLRPLGYAAEPPNVELKNLKRRPLTDHTFAGPDYSLLSTAEFPHKLDWMKEPHNPDPNCWTDYQKRTWKFNRDRNKIELIKADHMRHTLLKKAATVEVQPPTKIAKFGKTKFRITVKNHVAGHHFPTGFSEERQLWVEFVVRDQCGKILFVSGDLDNNGDLRDEHSHDLLTGHGHADRHLLNFQSKFMIITARGNQRSVTIPVNRDLGVVTFLRPASIPTVAFGRPHELRVHKTSLPPLGQRKHAYPVKIPSDVTQLQWSARLLYRNLPPSLLDKIGVGHLKHKLRIVEIDAQAGVLSIENSGHCTSLRPPLAPEVP